MEDTKVIPFKKPEVEEVKEGVDDLLANVEENKKRQQKLEAERAAANKGIIKGLKKGK